MIIKYFVIVLIPPGEKIGPISIMKTQTERQQNDIGKREREREMCLLDEERMRQILSLTVLFQQFVHLANVTGVLSCINTLTT